MSETGLPQAGAAAGDVPPGPTAGAMLRAAREAADMHVAAMAVSLKVPVAKLEALEQDRYDLLPDLVFARALASSICRTLKIDPQPVLERLPHSTRPRLVPDTEGINAPFRSPRDAVAPHWREQLTRPVSLVVGALLLGIVVVLLLPRPSEDSGGAVAQTTPVAGAPLQPSPVAVVPPPAAPAAEIVAAAIAPPAPAASRAATAASAPSVAASAAPAAVALAPAAAPPVAAAAASAPVGTELVVFRANAESWIEVRDARGAAPVRKTLAAGETAGASGTLPLRVTVGNVRGTQVQVRGKLMDLAAIARDNVARFEVK